MKGFIGILRDAETAYLQALLDTPTRMPTFVELPPEWWPDSWYQGCFARTLLKYVRAHCRVLKALYGHPVSGPLWEQKLVEIMTSEGWTAVPGNGSVFIHDETKAVTVL